MRQDLKLHLVAGLAISIVTSTISVASTPVLPVFCALFGYGAAALVGYLKEYWYDLARPENHTVDYTDFQYTSHGGALGSVLFLVAVELITQLR